MSDRAEQPKPINVFFLYDPTDDEHRVELEKHLSRLKRDGVIRSWSSRNVGAGEEWERAINSKLGEARLFLLLVSARMLASDQFFDVEIPRALARAEAGEAKRLLEDARPGSLKPLFPDISTAITGAIQELERQPRRVHRDKSTTSTICDLTKKERGKHLVIAPRGAGKSFALWDAANALLADSSTIPLFLPIGRFASWTEVLAHLKFLPLTQRAS
jgi:hypothetical protein